MKVAFKSQTHRIIFTEEVMSDILRRIESGDKLSDLERVTGIKANTIKRKLILLGHKTRGLSE